MLGDVGMDGAVVTADAARSCRETAQYIAGKGGRRRPGIGLFPFVKGNAPSLQRAAFDAIQATGPGHRLPRAELVMPGTAISPDG